MSSEKVVVADKAMEVVADEELGTLESKEPRRCSNGKKYLIIGGVAVIAMGIGAVISSVVTKSTLSTSAASSLSSVNENTITELCTTNGGQCACPGTNPKICKNQNCSERPFTAINYGGRACSEDLFGRPLDRCYCSNTPKLESSAAFKTLAMPENAVKKPITWYNVWDDRGSGADDDFGIFYPIPRDGALHKTYYPIGMSSLRRHQPPDETEQLLLHKNAPLEIARSALSFTLVWNDRGSGADRDVSIIRPVCPNGYSAVSDWAIDFHCWDESQCTQGFTRYMEYRNWAPRPCVNNNLLTSCDREHFVWNDRGSGAWADVSVKRFTRYDLQEKWITQANTVGLGYMRANYGPSSSNECLVAEKLKPVEPAAVVDVVEGSWERVSSCFGCDKIEYKIHRGVTKTKGLYTGIETSATSQLSISLSVKSKVGFLGTGGEAGVTTTLTDSFSETISRQLSTEVTQKIEIGTSVTCTKSYLLQFVSRVNAQLFAEEDNFEDFFIYDKHFLCTDNPKPACPAYSCKKGTDCKECCKDGNGDFAPCT